MSEYEFHMRVAVKDPSGYYHTRWDRATPLVIVASGRKEALRECWRVMGAAPASRTWTAQIDRVESVKASSVGGRDE